MYLSHHIYRFQCLSTRKQRDLEDELQAMVKKANDLQKANAKLQSELQQKENLISAQGIHCQFYSLYKIKNSIVV